MIIKAIDTEYAGHLFRSRLEARWAYVFDLMKIRWEYEPAGFEVSARLTGSEGFRYLPDFWLPDLKLWVEVKGALRTEAELWKVLNAAASLSEGDGHDTILCGPIAADFSAPLRLHAAGDGWLDRAAWGQDSPEGQMGTGVAAPGPGGRLWIYSFKVGGAPVTEWTDGARWLLGGHDLRATEPLLSAMQQAAKVRFDHGLTPERPI